MPPNNYPGAIPNPNARDIVIENQIVCNGCVNNIVKRIEYDDETTSFEIL